MTESDKDNMTTSKKSSDGCVLDRMPPGQVFQRHVELRRFPSVILLSLLSVILLNVSFAPFDCWYMAYFALVPWALAMAGGTRPKCTILVGWLSGLIFWLACVYWLILPTGIGYFAACGYLSVYWLVASWLVRVCMKRNLAMWICLPLIWISLEYVRSHVIGFSWFFLSQTQYQNLPLIQISDATGQYGVSFFVALVNGLLIDLLTAPLFSLSAGRVKLARQTFLGLIVTAGCLVGMLSYGYYRLGQRDEVVSQGPRFGIVQDTFPLSLTRPATSQSEFLRRHLRQSMDFLGRECDLVIWPETMLPQGLNKQLVMANVGKLLADDVRSLAYFFFGPKSQEYPVERLRDNLNRIIGRKPLVAYHRSALLYILGEYVTVAMVEKLSDETIQHLSATAFTPQMIAKTSPQSLRLAVQCFTSDAGRLLRDSTPSKQTQVSLQKVFTWACNAFSPAYDMNLKTGSARRQPESLEEFLRRISSWRVKAQRDLKTIRGQAAQVQMASLLLDCPILTGGGALVRNSRPTGWKDTWVQQNSAIWITADGYGPDYAKVHLVPFSEYLPLKYSWPVGHAFLRQFVPTEMPQLEPGKKFTRFDFPTARNGHCQLVTPICFEGTFGRLGRQMVANGSKDRLIMLNLSNDGWFVTNRKYVAFGDELEYDYRTTEHAQHLVHYVFRAIENRVPVVRSVNTGISGYINSDGKMESILEISAGDYRKETMVAGTLVVEVQPDSRNTLYTRWGDWFAQLISVGALGLLGFLWINRKTFCKEQTSESN